MRQHVNPLSQFYQLPLSLPSKSILFKYSHYPIHIDVGSAKGEFLIELASIYPEWNFLGLDIRKTLVNSAERKRKKLGLENLKFLFCNVNVSLEEWLSDLDYDQLKRVSIQFPDPWFKRKHFKRRVLKNSFINSIARYMSKDSELFIQSDIFKLIESMINIIDNSTFFERKEIGGVKWLNKNPYDVCTDRECFVIRKNLPIYRAVYIRNRKSFSN